MKAKLTLPASDLADLLRPVLPFADTGGDPVPVLSAVLIERHGRWATATATNRWAAGMSRVDIGHGDPFDALVYATDCRRILAMFKPTRTSNPAITLDRAGEMLTVETEGVLADFAQLRAGFHLCGGVPFPDVRGLIAAAHAEAPALTEPIGLNAVLLSSFRDVVRDRAPLVIRGRHPEKTVVISCGEHFIGLIMPAKHSSGSHPVPDWSEVLGRPDGS